MQQYYQVLCPYACCKLLEGKRLNNPISFRNSKNSYIFKIELFRMPQFEFSSPFQEDVRLPKNCFSEKSQFSKLWHRISLLSSDDIILLVHINVIFQSTRIASDFATKFFQNHFHDILRLFDVLTNFPFATSETMRNYYL